MKLPYAPAPSCTGYSRHLRIWLLAGMLLTAFLSLSASEPALSGNSWIAEILDGPETVPQGGRLCLLLLVIALATLITEDLTCVTTGLLIANGTLTWNQGVGACLFGILFGDFLLYLAGRKLGRPALQRIPLRWMINPVKLLEIEEWFRRRGGLTILISRFIPGTRLPAYVAAGLMGMPYLRFLTFFSIAAVLWTPALVLLSTKVAGRALRWVDQYHHAAPLAFMALVVIYLLVLKGLIPAFTWQGRRQLLRRWYRLTRPEYWPTLVLYFPVFWDLLARSLRQGRHPMDFSACNPCMPGSGVVEESKKDILDQIADRQAVADYMYLPAGISADEKIDRVLAFMAEKRLDFPLVLKPDVGQRGQQVVVAGSREEVEQTLSEVKSGFLAQAYIPGIEFGVFYIRHPDAEKGRIFAITQKTFHVLTGDGTHTLEELILRDERALCQSDIHLRQFQHRLFEVPGAGERIPLTRVGNHARGTLFEDGLRHCTRELEERVEEISRSLPGFYFGRYDIMVPDAEAFRRGEQLKVIELNGVTSEATSLYDPRNSYFTMVGVLLRQWREASEIGVRLQKEGQPRMKFIELIRQYDQYVQRQNRRNLRRSRRPLPQA